MSINFEGAEYSWAHLTRLSCKLQKHLYFPAFDASEFFDMLAEKAAPGPHPPAEGSLPTDRLPLRL